MQFRRRKKKSNGKTLKFIPISGTTGVAENMYVYEYGDDMIIVDCGIGFPVSDMYGVDLIIPDFSYIRKNIKKLRGIVITHGHEDHMGALPFLLKDINTKIYSTKLVAGFIDDKLKDAGIEKRNIKVFNPEKDVMTLGVFRITPFRISHSVPDSVGFCIDTPEGKIFHVPDYKFDWTPVDRHTFDIARASILASSGVLALASDSLGANTPGHTESEMKIEPKIESIMKKATGRIVVTTISSNISRMKQVMNVAEKLNRKVVFLGRSTERKASIARDLGYLSTPRGLTVHARRAKRMDKKSLVYIASGSYGQPGSALAKAARGENDLLTIDPRDTVIFLGDPSPPGSKSSVDGLVDRMIGANIDVHYYDLQEDLHVSGHGSQEDIKTLFALIKPKFFIPIGGTIRFNRGYSEIAQEMGARQGDVFELLSGEVLEFSEGRAKKIMKIPLKNVLVDGLGVGDVGSVVLRDRKQLAKDGVVVILLKIGKNDKKLVGEPVIISRGFVFQKATRKFIEKTTRELKLELSRKKDLDAKFAREVTINFLERYLYRETRRRPMVVPVIVEV